MSASLRADNISEKEIFFTILHTNDEHSSLIPHSPAGNFITDAMRIITEKISGNKVDVALQARGNIRKYFQPGRKGDITFYEITEVVGLGRGLDKVPGFPVVTVYFTGEEIKKIIEVGKLLEQIYSDSLFFHLSGLKYEYNPSDIILFNIPIINQPIPTMRAVKNIKIYSGNFLQTAKNNSGYINNYKPLDNDKLYNFVADSYTLSFIPLVVDLIPAFDIVPKNKYGEPLDPSEIVNRTVEYQQRELKVWETVMKYAQLQPAAEDGLPRIPEYYKDISGRILETDSWTYLQKLITGMAVTAGIIFLDGSIKIKLLEILIYW